MVPSTLGRMAAEGPAIASTTFTHNADSAALAMQKEKLLIKMNS